MSLQLTQLTSLSCLNILSKYAGFIYCHKQSSLFIRSLMLQKEKEKRRWKGGAARLLGKIDEDFSIFNRIENPPT